MPLPTSTERVPRLLAIAALMALLYAPASSSQPRPTFLTNEQLRETLSGHTLIGKTWAEYYQSDGTLHGRLKVFGFNYDGTWKIEDGKVCYHYPDPSKDRCSRLTRDGDTVRHFTPEGTPKDDGVARRLEGNRIASL